MYRDFRHVIVFLKKLFVISKNVFIFYFCSVFQKMFCVFLKFLPNVKKDHLYYFDPFFKKYLKTKKCSYFMKCLRFQNFVHKFDNVCVTESLVFSKIKSRFCECSIPQKEKHQQEVFGQIPQWDFSFCESFKFLPLSIVSLIVALLTYHKICLSYWLAQPAHYYKLAVRILAFFFAVFHLTDAKWAGPCDPLLCETWIL